MLDAVISCRANPRATKDPGQNVKDNSTINHGRKLNCKITHRAICTVVLYYRYIFVLCSTLTTERLSMPVPLVADNVATKIPGNLGIYTAPTLALSSSS